MPQPRGHCRTEDRYLVAAASAGSAPAYDELARRYRGALTLLARRIVGSRETAEDVAQEALLAAFGKLGSLKDARQFGPWLRVIAINLARRHARRDSAHVATEDCVLESLAQRNDAGGDSGPEAALLRAERVAALRDLIAGLNEPTQIVVELYYREQWSVAHIAEFLSVAATTVKWRLHAGRREIARRLAEWSGDTDCPVAPDPGTI
ncbi:MAG TPA: sigma-70 family RNA polymerase sigma factor [Chthonomonadaceae bacterium]|nr:sigma-70 family RNA polymerase sigma factor [Chthonomonadaceae bacterium]